MSNSTPVAQREPLFVDVPEACRLIQCGRTTLYAMAKRGEIRFTKLGGLTRVSIAELERLAQ